VETTRISQTAYWVGDFVVEMANDKYTQEEWDSQFISDEVDIDFTIKRSFANSEEYWDFKEDLRIELEVAFERAAIGFFGENWREFVSR
jgi:hypothetical protein